MAFTREIFNDSRIRVVAWQDPAVDQDSTTRDVYDTYLKTLDEGLLTFFPGQAPTRFVLKTFLGERERAHIIDNQITIGEDKRVQVKASSGEEEVRIALVDIENEVTDSTSLRWEKDKGDKWTCRELIARLAQWGIVGELKIAREHNRPAGLALVKKS